MVLKSVFINVVIVPWKLKWIQTDLQVYQGNIECPFEHICGKVLHKYSLLLPIHTIINTKCMFVCLYTFFENDLDALWHKVAGFLRSFSLCLSLWVEVARRLFYAVLTLIIIYNKIGLYMYVCVWWYGKMLVIVVLCIIKKVTNKVQLINCNQT